MQSINVEVLARDREDKSSVLLLTFRTGCRLLAPLTLSHSVLRCVLLHGVAKDSVSLELGLMDMSDPQEMLLALVHTALCLSLISG